MATDVFGVVFRGRVESSQCRGESKVAHRRRRILARTLHPTLKSLRGGGVPSSHPSLGLCVFLCTRLAHL